MNIGTGEKLLNQQILLSDRSNINMSSSAPFRLITICSITILSQEFFFKAVWFVMYHNAQLCTRSMTFVWTQKRLCWSEKFRVGWTMFQLILTFCRCDCNQAVFRYLKIFDNSETQFNSGPEAKFTTKCVEVISIWTSAKYVKGGKG